MNKKVMMMGTILVTVSLLAIMAFAGNSTNSGYELFKDVLGNFEKHEFESGVFAGSIILTDNDEIKLAVSGTAVQQKENERMSGTAQIETQDMIKTLEIYGDEQSVYIVDSGKKEVYIGKVAEEKTSREWNREHMGTFDEKDEAIIDYFMGNFKKNFKTVADTDGSTDILFELGKSEIPAIVNLLASSRHDDKYKDEDNEFSNHQEYANYPLFNELMTLENIELSIDSNIEVQYVKFVMDLDLNQKVKGFEFTFEITGDDESGNRHEVKIEGFFTADENKDAQVRTLNMDGLTVYELPEENK
jgi:hypothetical protein